MQRVPGWGPNGSLKAVGYSYILVCIGQPYGWSPAFQYKISVQPKGMWLVARSTIYSFQSLRSLIVHANRQTPIE